MHLFRPSLSGRRCGSGLSNGRYGRLPAAGRLEQIFDLEDALSFFERRVELVVAQRAVSLMVIEGDVIVVEAI